jgi:hypothetical protein
LARKKSRPGDLPDDAPLGDAPRDETPDPESGLPVEGAATEPAPAESIPPVAALSADPPALTHLRERIDRLEQALAPLQQLDGLEERLFQRVTTYVERTRPEPPPPSTQIAEPSILARASALGAAGKQVFEAVVLPALSPGPSSAPRPPGRPWAIREIFAELQAMFYMYVDPRYRLSWPGRVMTPVFLALFLTTDWWAPYAFCGIGKLLIKPIEILLCFGLIKFLSYESRRYRETAPDLPSSLRL